MVSKLKKYDPGCSSRIPDPDADFSPIPDPGVQKAPDPGSATLGKNQLICWEGLTWLSQRYQARTGEDGQM
jgi:hypothetical protein